VRETAGETRSGGSSAANVAELCSQPLGGDEAIGFDIAEVQPGILDRYIARRTAEAGAAPVS
jgi:methylglyoxal synthase